MRLGDDVPDTARGPAAGLPLLTSVPQATWTRPSRGIRVRSTARRGYLVLRAWRRLRSLLGGLVSTCAAGLSWLNILLPLHIAMDLGGGDDELTPDERALFDAVGRLLVLVLVATIGASLAGRYLLRTRRGTVLWLRKFQYSNATRVVAAALDHIGRTWRVVTLDDLSTPPVGVALGLRLPGRLLALAGQAGPRIARLVIAVGGLTTRLSIAGLLALAVWSWSQGELLVLLDALPGSGPRPDTLEADLLLVFIVLLVGQFVVLLAYAVLRLALLPLLGLALLAQDVQEQISDTETAKLRTVRTSADIPTVVRSVVAASQRALAPRLTVLRVDAAVWQETVVELAGSCCAVVLDVSRPTDNLIWEVEQVTSRVRARIVFVAHVDCLDGLVGAAPTAGADPVADAMALRLRTLLDGAEVLAYSTDLRGRVRFQRALFAELESTLVRPRLDARGVRRALVACLGGTAFVVALLQARDVVSPWL